MSRVRPRAPYVVAVAILTLLAGCSGSSSSAGTAGSLVPAGAITPLDPAVATAAYGYAATRNAQVTYQPDVVIVEGGPTIVRWVSSDGLTWALDPNAKGVSDLKVGSVMFATSRAVGRVVDLQDQDGSKIVTLAPIDLTQLVSDADLHLDQQVDFGSVVYQQIPDLPGAVEADGPATPDSSPAPSAAADAGPSTAAAGDVVELPPVRLVASHSNATMPQTATSCPTLSIGTWSVKGCSEPSKLTIGIDRNLNPVRGDGISSGLKLGATITFNLDPLFRVTGDEQIQGSKVTSSGAAVHGLKGVDVKVTGGASDGALDNGKITLELPIQLEYPIPPSPATAGLPMNFVIEFKLSLTTAFSGKNSTLSAEGSYLFDGPIEMLNGAASPMTLSVQKSILQTLTGIDIGPSGVVLAAKDKFQFGLGVPGTVAGPFVTVTVSLGISRGSALGSPIADCRSATVVVFIGAGVGFQANLSYLTKLLGSDVKLKVETEGKVEVFNETQTEPDSGACKGS